MVLFGIEFSPAEAVLLGIGVLLVLMMVALLRKSAPRAERAAQPIRLTHLQSGHSLTRKDNTRIKPAHSGAGFIKKKSG